MEETRDERNHEFLSSGLRFEKQEKVFKNLVHVSQLQDGKLDAVNALDVSTDHLISQFYDGASVMSGCRERVHQ